MKFAGVEPGQFVRVSGLLRQASFGVTKMHCDDGCCNESTAALGVYGSAGSHVILHDDAFHCIGHASMPCCKVDAVCERVVATGRYMPGTEDAPETPQITVTSLCVVQD